MTRLSRYVCSGCIVLAALVSTGCRTVGQRGDPTPIAALPESPCLQLEGTGPGAFATALRQHLERDVLPFWTAPGVVDARHGGFLTWLDASGKALDPDAVKPLIAQLRLLFVHAVAIERATDPAARARIREQYDQGFEFVRAHYLTPAGGWVAETTRDGTVSNAGKQTVVQAYVVYTMAELWQRLSDSRARDLALQTMAWMDAHAHDAAHGGYLEYGDLPADDPANRLKSMGTQLHAMLALARLFPLSPRAAHRQRLNELIDRLVAALPADSGRNPALQVTHDWQPARSAEGSDGQQTLYGHTAETVWYTLDALQAAARSPRDLQPWITALAEGVLRDGVMEDGGVYVWGPERGAGGDPDDIRWWPQTEVMIMLARMGRLTGDPRFMRWFERVTRFTLGHLAPDRSGAWLGGIHRRTGERSPRGGWAWKSGLHVVRALVECERALTAPTAPWPKPRPPRGRTQRAAQLEPGFAYYHGRSTESIVAEFRANGLDCIHLICLTDRMPLPGLARECRRHGVEIWGTFFPTGIYMPQALFGADAPSWRMQFTRDSSFDGYRFYSYIHADYQDRWRRHLTALYEQEPLDGMLFYEVHYPTQAGPVQHGPKALFSDVSPAFRQAFARATGRRDFPNFTDPALPDYYETDRALFGDFVEFRIRSIIDFQKGILDGPEGFRARFPDVLFATWTISLARENGLAALRENESQDPGRLVAELRPDMHILQSHYPDWYPQQQTPTYLAKYAPYAEAVREASPRMPLGVQLDACSTCPWRRSPEWMAAAYKQAKSLGADSTTYYEFSLRWEVYFAPPKAVRAVLGADGNAMITFDQRLAPASTARLEGLALPGELRVRDVSVDGNLLRFRVEGTRQPGRAISFPIEGISDDPTVRLPLPGKGVGEAHAIPEGTRVLLEPGTAG